jgi:hypothetical protein
MSLFDEVREKVREIYNQGYLCGFNSEGDGDYDETANEVIEIFKQHGLTENTSTLLLLKSSDSNFRGTVELRSLQELFALTKISGGRLVIHSDWKDLTAEVDTSGQFAIEVYDGWRE